MLPRENHLFGCTRSKLGQGSVPVGLALASDFASAAMRAAMHDALDSEQHILINDVGSLVHSIRRRVARWLARM
jgi:hypothetical protein